jgi:hypothetical protein
MRKPSNKNAPKMEGSKKLMPQINEDKDIIAIFS